jgi:UDP-2,3-diacylglucosamine pyrophosphatase LpxH
MAPQRTVVLADLHLTRMTPVAVSRDLASLVEAHAGARLVFAGDLFDLSADSPGTPSEQAVRDALAAHPEARAALGRHVEHGGELWLVSGNHDADVSLPAFRASLLESLGAHGAARDRVRSTPWFFRDGGLHLEHGHLYDPDNAPAHPLVIGEASLGVHFVEQFIAPTGAYAYLNANDGTPLHLFLSAFTWYGPRAPHVIYRYFHTAIAAMLRSGPFYRAHGERTTGAERILSFAEEVGLSEAAVAELIALGATPTLESLASTFTRLYFDRVLATLALMGGLGAAALGRRSLAGVALAAGALLMGASWARGHDRYSGSVTERLAKGAGEVARTTQAKLVVFGHTHAEALHDGYANTGSFSFPKSSPGRPFLEIEGTHATPHAVRRYWPRSG